MSITKLFSWYLIKTTKGDIMKPYKLNELAIKFLKAQPKATVSDFAKYLKAHNLKINIVSSN
jgi:hypothetical protein